MDTIHQTFGIFSVIYGSIDEIVFPLATRARGTGTDDYGRRLLALRSSGKPHDAGDLPALPPRAGAVCKTHECARALRPGDVRRIQGVVASPPTEQRAWVRLPRGGRTGRSPPASRQYGILRAEERVPSAIPHLNEDDLPKVPFILDRISTRFIREMRIVPLELKNNVLKVLMANPEDREAVDALKVAVAGDVAVCTADAKMIDEYIAKFYTQEAQNIDRIIEDMDGGSLEFVSEAEEDIGHLKDLASEAPIIKLVNLFITRAVEGRASDIHVEPFEDELKVRYRIDGVLHDIESIPKKLQAAIVSRIKIMAKLNIAERRLPQDGRIRLLVGSREIDLRVSSIPVVHGESIVMRILDKEGIKIDLSVLGFPPGTLAVFNQLITKPNGIFLVTGPTGSGKTTTLYGALDKINSPDKKIITVEDPVEYELKGINQIQVKAQIGLTFATTLRHIVRQDPDIIMIGEIRDLETAEIAIQSALTGHLVFSTLHTNDAPSAITRLLDMGVENFLLSSTIRGILAQRLVRVICPVCKEIDPIAQDKEELKILGSSGTATLYKGKGCESCVYTGYHGRSGIFELLTVTDELRKLILKCADANELREAARAQGMITLLEDGIQKITSGVTTLSEVFRVTQEA
ncbi:MAG: type II secretion system ATPase GspE [Syntrophales bacterium LBB04]|nr:type II secretion system ATPase GspE [Syntrophales bacterium LBB04]